MTNRATLTALLERLDVLAEKWEVQRYGDRGLREAAERTADVLRDAAATLRSLAAGGEGQRKPTTLSGECPCDGPTRIAPDCPHHGTKARTAGQGHAATPASEVRISVEAAQSNPARDLACPPPFPALRQEPTNCKHEALHAETGHVASCFPPAVLDREALVKLAEKWDAEAVRHKKHGDSYRVGQGWGMEQCATELQELLRPVSAPEETGR